MHARVLGRSVVGLWLVWLGVAAAACGGGGGSSGGPDGGPDAGSMIRSDGDDPGVKVTQLVVATEGGTLTAADGATLTIPPGALAADTMITIGTPTGQTSATKDRLYVLEPSGLTFSTPAILRLPRATPDDQLAVYQSSLSNEVTTNVDDSTSWQLAELAASEPGYVDVKLAHFTFIYGFQMLGELAYLVVDMPSKYLLPGDLVFVLTELLGSGFNWAPGHVGAFTGGPDNTNNLIEANDTSVRRFPLRKFKDRTAGHLYMGPRRPAGGELTVGQRNGMIDFMVSRLGNEYSTVGQSLVNPGEDKYSCVSLMEAALDSVGRGQLTTFQSLAAAAPIELFHKTVPILELTEDPLVKISIPIYGVMIDPGSKIWLLGSDFFYNKNGAYTITPSGMPSTATFPAASTGGYVFEWTPGVEHAGMTFNIPLVMQGTASFSTLLGTVSHPVSITETLVIHIRPVQASRCPSATAPNPEAPDAVQVACRVGGPQVAADAAAGVAALDVGGEFGNSNPLVPTALVEAIVDLTTFAAILGGLDAETITRDFLNTDFPCGAGKYAQTLCPATDTLSTADAGDFVIVQHVLGADVALADPVNSFQYGFVFDADGVAGNNYQASAPYQDDYFQGTDRWYAAEYTPATGWQLKVTLARGSFQQVPSGARLIILGRTMTLVVPRDEFETDDPGFRLTAFRHTGDYGQNPPHDYSADAYPRVRTPLQVLFGESR